MTDKSSHISSLRQVHGEAHACGITLQLEPQFQQARGSYPPASRETRYANARAEEKPDGLDLTLDLILRLALAEAYRYSIFPTVADLPKLRADYLERCLTYARAA